MGNEEGLPFWSEHAKELEGSTGGKIKAILEQGCIEYDKEGKRYLCKPIMQKNGKPYNKTTHFLTTKKGIVECSCQGYQIRKKKWLEDPIANPPPNCSHCAALHEFWKRGHVHRREERIQCALIMFEESR